jgi:hypothetical protein
LPRSLIRAAIIAFASASRSRWASTLVFEPICH